MNRVYVCSDLHSHLDVLLMALDDMDETDRLIIIGDVVDKGPDNIKVLQTVMHDPRCELLIGNHDLMFLQYLRCVKYAQDTDELKDITLVWVIMNQGALTMQSYLHITEEEQQEIQDYLQKCSLVRNVEVEGNKFLLVHAALPKDLEDIDGDLYLDTIEDPEHEHLYNWRNEYVWGRYETHIPGKTVITGHTIVQSLGSNDIIENDHWLDIDCGLAMRDNGSRLAVLCLNDMKVKYYTPGIY